MAIRPAPARWTLVVHRTHTAFPQAVRPSVIDPRYSAHMAVQPASFPRVVLVLHAAATRYRADHPPRSPHPAGIFPARRILHGRGVPVFPAWSAWPAFDHMHLPLWVHHPVHHTRLSLASPHTSQRFEKQVLQAFPLFRPWSGQLRSPSCTISRINASLLWAACFHPTPTTRHHHILPPRCAYRQSAHRGWPHACHAALARAGVFAAFRCPALPQPLHQRTRKPGCSPWSRHPGMSI